MPTRRLDRRCDLREAEKPGPVAPPLWPLVAVVPVLVGALWLWWDARSGLPGVLVGAVGNAIGTYLGILVAEFLR